jgi:hypothetical protein
VEKKGEEFLRFVFGRDESCTIGENKLNNRENERGKSTEREMMHLPAETDSAKLDRVPLGRCELPKLEPNPFCAHAG